MIEAKVVDESQKEKWNPFVARNENCHILQSWEWGQFRESWGTPPIRVAVLEEGEIKAVCSFTLHKVPILNRYVGYCGKGPVFEDVKYLKPLFEEVDKVARQRGVIFIKFEPNITDDAGNYFNKHLRKSPKEIFASQTLEIDLTKSEEDLLASFHPKWRYNVRLGAKKGLTTHVISNALEKAADPVIANELKQSEEIRKQVQDNAKIPKTTISSKDAIEKFLKTQHLTAARDKFFVHPDNYYRKIWELLYPLGHAHMVIAEMEGKTAAAWFLFSFGNYLYYPYGASNYEFRQLMPSHAIMWEAIKLGKKLELKKFDLWGAAKHINGEVDPQDPWAGFTRFKEGFNPERKVFIGAYDMVISQTLYHTFLVSDKIRWAILRTLRR